MEYMCRVFDLVEGNEWFGRNKKVDLTRKDTLKTTKVDIDFYVNEDLLTDQEIQDRLSHLDNFPVPYLVKAMPPQFTNTVKSANLPLEKKIAITQKILDKFNLIWFINEDKVSHFCYELTCMKCSTKGYPRPREYGTYDPDKRVTPSASSFTASRQDFKKFMAREEFTNKVMEKFNVPVITYKDFFDNQDKEIKRIAEHFNLTPKKVNKIPIIQNPDYSKIFTNYKVICEWFTTY
jgi:hypothetical protein